MWFSPCSGEKPLKCCVQFWASLSAKDVKGLEQVERKAAELGKGLEHKSDEEELGGLMPAKRLPGEDPISLYNSQTGGCNQVGVGLCSSTNQ